LADERIVVDVVRQRAHGCIYESKMIGVVLAMFVKCQVLEILVRIIKQMAFSRDVIKMFL
jgi:hypothetical protein